MPRLPDGIDDSSLVPPNLRPDRYSMMIKDRKPHVKRADSTKHFVKPATANGTPKVYVVSKGARLLYVGVTTQPMATRLRGGLNAKGEHGYSGYPWRNRRDTLSLSIWYLVGPNTRQTDLEAIEAEVVFLYRQQSGNWPQEQTEIHFRQSNGWHRERAKRIIDALKG